MSMGGLPSSLERQVVLLTGMSRGLGQRLAAAFWSRGADLFGTARDLQALEAVARKLAASPVRAGQRIAVVKADLENDGAPEFVVRQCWDQLGGLDVLISNAAVQGPIGRFWEQDLARVENALAVNLAAPLRLAHAAIPFMLRGEKKGRSILFLSGGGAAGPRPRFGVYATAKAGLVRFAETLAMELRDFEISVNCIAPGAMATDMLAEVAAAGVDLAGAGEIAAVGRIKDAESEVTMTRAAELAVFLATAGLGITGKLISAPWDRWEDWPLHLDELNSSDVYTLRRITGRDRNKPWGDR